MIESNIRRRTVLIFLIDKSSFRFEEYNEITFNGLIVVIAIGFISLITFVIFFILLVVCPLIIIIKFTTLFFV